MKLSLAKIAIVLLLSATILCCFYFGSFELKRTSAVNAMDLIVPEMTFSEISKLIPLKKHHLNLKEHGGAFFDVPINDEYVIKLRFEHSSSDLPLEETMINYSPSLRNRQTNEFVVGKRESWATERDRYIEREVARQTERYEAEREQK